MNQHLRKTVFLYLLLMPGVSLSAVPEGLENFGLLNAGSPSTSLSTLISYTNPAWSSDYSSFESIGSTPLGGDLLTFGGKVTIANEYGDRSAYFLRYDWILGGTNSLSLKWSHEDWKFISSSKDSFGLEYSHYFSVAGSVSAYFSFGGYYRYLKQKWNDPWWGPLNLNTKDRETYFTGTAGFQSKWSESFFYTFDINIRDAFSYYSLDHVAYELNLYMGAKGFYWKLYGGVRTSAVWVGTAYPAIVYGGLGFVVH